MLDAVLWLGLPLLLLPELEEDENDKISYSVERDSAGIDSGSTCELTDDDPDEESEESDDEELASTIRPTDRMRLRETRITRIHIIPVDEERLFNQDPAAPEVVGNL